MNRNKENQNTLNSLGTNQQKQVKLAPIMSQGERHKTHISAVGARRGQTFPSFSITLEYNRLSDCFSFLVLFRLSFPCFSSSFQSARVLERVCVWGCVRACVRTCSACAQLGQRRGLGSLPGSCYTHSQEAAQPPDCPHLDPS